jgi:hypothetical protein
VIVLSRSQQKIDDLKAYILDIQNGKLFSFLAFIDKEENILEVQNLIKSNFGEIHTVVVFISIHFTILSHIFKSSSNRIQPNNSSFFLVCTMTHSILSLETVASVLLLSTIIVGLAPDRAVARSSCRQPVRDSGNES